MKPLNASFLLILTASVLAQTDANPVQNESPQSNASPQPSQPNKPTSSDNPVPTKGELSSPKQTQAPEKEGRPNNDQQRGTDQSPVIKIDPTPNAEDEAGRGKKEKEQKAAVERGMELTTYIVTGATAIQAIGLIFTIFVMMRTARRQLRAYVHLSGNFNLDQCEIGKLIKISFPIRNYGQTPAHDMILRGWVGVRPYPPPAGWHIVPSGQEIRSVTVCAPGDQNRRGSGVSETVLSKEMFNEILAGTEWRLYAWALITYRDVFGKKIRTTEARAFTGGPDFATARQPPTQHPKVNPQPRL